MHSVRIVYISTYKDLVEGWALVLQLASSTFYSASSLHALSITTTLSWSSIPDIFLPSHSSAPEFLLFACPHTSHHQLSNISPPLQLLHVLFSQTIPSSILDPLLYAIHHFEFTNLPFLRQMSFIWQAQPKFGKRRSYIHSYIQHCLVTNHSQKFVTWSQLDWNEQDGWELRIFRLSQRNIRVGGETL